MEAWPAQKGSFWLSALLVALAVIEAAGDDCAHPKITRVPLVHFTCEARDFPNATCSGPDAVKKGLDYKYRGSELNDGSFLITKSDEECCSVCQKTTGCRVWSRFHTGSQFNALGACWLKSTTSGAEESNVINSGLVHPPEQSAPCKALIGVGFRNTPPYNFPDLLLVEEAETCCQWCQEENEFCTGWTWVKSSGHCYLYGTPLKASDEFTCRDCYSGRRRAAREDLRNMASCQPSRFIRKSYVGSSRIQIVQKNSLITETSVECCGLCTRIRGCRSWTWTHDKQCSLNADIPRPGEDFRSVGGVAAIKVCKSEKCNYFPDVEIIEGSLHKSQCGSPSGEELLVPTREACCDRCQEVAECNAWVFVQGPNGEEWSPCWLKTVSYWYDVSRAKRSDTWAGIIENRLSNKTKTEIIRLFKDLHIKDTNGERSPLLSPAAIGGLVVAIVLLSIVVWVLYYVIRRRMIRKRQHHGRMLRPTSRIAVDPPPAVLMPKFSPSRMISNTSPGPQFQIDQCYEFVGSSTCMPSVVSSSQHTVEESEALERFLDECGEDSEQFKKLLTPVEVDDPKWLQYGCTLTSLVRGRMLGGKYEIDDGYYSGHQSIVVNAIHNMFAGKPLAAIKFFRWEADYDLELKFFHDNRDSSYVPQVFDIFYSEEVESWGLPPLCCIIMERGTTTLSEMLSLNGRKLDHMDQRNILYKICKAVDDLHDRDIVHRNLKPENIVMFNKTLTWKLLDFGSWGKKGTIGSTHCTLRYAPPEVAEAHVLGRPLTVLPAADMWALGVIVWEILTGDSLFGHEYTDKQVLSMLVGIEEFPFEKHPEMWHSIQNPVARRLAMNLLQRCPVKRLTAKSVLMNGYFFSAPDSLQVHERNEVVSSILSSIAGAIKNVESQVEKVENIAIENLKEIVGNVLICCISMYEIEDEEFVREIQNDSRLAEMYQDQCLPIRKAYLEPNFNVFKRENGEPAILLRMHKNHLMKVTLMYGGDVALDLPVSEMVYAQITPVDAEKDTQEMQLCMVSNQGHVMDAVGVWKTTGHKEPCLTQIGSVSVQVCLGIRMKSTEEIIEVRKTIDLRVHPENERFRSIKQFYRSKKFYSNIPPWGKIYIHGAVAIVSLAMKGVL